MSRDYYAVPDHEKRSTISLAIDRATTQLEACTDAETSSAWAQVLEGLEYVVEFAERIERRETRLIACHRAVRHE